MIPTTTTHCIAKGPSANSIITDDATLAESGAIKNINIFVFEARVRILKQDHWFIAYTISIDFNKGSLYGPYRTRIKMNIIIPINAQHRGMFLLTISSSKSFRRAKRGSDFKVATISVHNVSKIIVVVVSNITNLSAE